MRKSIILMSLVCTTLLLLALVSWLLFPSDVAQAINTVRVSLGLKVLPEYHKEILLIDPGSVPAEKGESFEGSAKSGALLPTTLVPIESQVSDKSEAAILESVVKIHTDSADEQADIGGSANGPSNEEVTEANPTDRTAVIGLLETRSMTESAEVGIHVSDWELLSVPLETLLEEGIPEDEDVVALTQDEFLDLAPSEPTYLTGRIIDKDSGVGIGSANISILSTFYKNHLFYDYELKEVGSTTADPSGYFTFQLIDAETPIHKQGSGLRLSVHRRGYSTLSAYHLDKITPGKENTLPDIRLSSASLTLSGKVVDQHGAPVESALVTATGDVYPYRYDKDQRQLVLRNFPNARTNAQGKYTIENVDQGSHFLSVHVGIDGLGIRQLKINKDLENVNFQIRVGGKVTGYVRDHNGNPIGSAVVNGGGNTTNSDANGHFVLENITEGSWTMMVLHHAFKHVSIQDVRSGWEDMDVVMAEPLAEILLRITDFDSREAIYTIQLNYQFSRNQYLAVPLSPVLVSETGHYHVRVPEFCKSITIHVEGYQMHALDMSQVVHSESFDVFLQATE